MSGTETVVLLLGIVAVVAAAVLTVRLARGWLAATSEAEDVRRLLMREAAWREEAARLMAIRAPLADGAQRAADAVDLGATVTRLGHRTVAGLSFAVLKAIPATRDRSARIQTGHDRISGRVYGAINEATDSARRASRSLRGDGVADPQALDALGALEAPAEPEPPAV
ncbi:MAG: hypothetical protein QM572_12640 [Nocardioides sp.]|uniref:hypothetical protein n=1 Tax=Nocardioides sp. TaxID=35761 RepID=UPI0039E28500